MDATVATGAAAMMAIRVLLDHDVKEENINLVSKFMRKPLIPRSCIPGAAWVCLPFYVLETLDHLLCLVLFPTSLAWRVKNHLGENDQSPSWMQKNGSLELRSRVVNFNMFEWCWSDINCGRSTKFIQRKNIDFSLNPETLDMVTRTLQGVKTTDKF